jgi:hypothetical protein
MPWERIESGCIDPYFLDLGTSSRWVINLTHRQLYSRGKRPRYTLDGWTSEPIWTIWRRENSSSYWDSNSDPSVVQSVVSRYTDYAIPTTPMDWYYLHIKPSLYLSLQNVRNYYIPPSLLLLSRQHFVTVCIPYIGEALTTCSNGGSD